jgi:hypothetical protein
VPYINRRKPEMKRPANSNINGDLRDEEKIAKYVRLELNAVFVCHKQSCEFEKVKTVARVYSISSNCIVHVCA